MLGVAVAAALRDDAAPFVSRETFFLEAEALERSIDDARDSLSQLNRQGLLEDYGWYGAGEVAFRYRATPGGVNRWLSASDPQVYEQNLRRAGAAVFNEHCRNKFQVQNTTAMPLPHVNHYLDELEARGLVKIRRVSAGGMLPVEGTVALRRFLKT